MVAAHIGISRYYEHGIPRQSRFGTVYNASLYNHHITARWLHIAEHIFTYLDSFQVSWSSINPPAYASEGGTKPFCSLLISIGVPSDSLPYDAACATAPDSNLEGTLVEEDLPDVKVAMVESSTARHAGTPMSSHLLSFTRGDYWPSMSTLIWPFTALFGISIALLERPDLFGTGGLVFCPGKDTDDASDKPVLGLLTCAHVALPPTAYGSELQRGHDVDEPSHTAEYITLDEAGYAKAMEDMNISTLQERFDIEHLTKSVENKVVLQSSNGEEIRDQRRKWLEERAVRVDLAQAKISWVEALRAEVHKKCAAPSQRRLGSLLYSPPLHVPSPDRFTSDWAMIAIDQVHQSMFAGNKIYLGGTRVWSGFHDLLFPHERKARRTDFSMFPPGGLLQVSGVVGEAEVRNPGNLDEHGEPCLFVVKNGAGTGTTFGRVNGLESFVRTFAGDEKVTTKEIAVVGRSRLSYHYQNGVFSGEGDSGAVVVTRDGRIVGLLNGGMSGTRDISYTTPFWWLEQQIKEKFPDSYLYEVV